MADLVSNYLEIFHQFLMNFNERVDIQEKSRSFFLSWIRQMIIIVEKTGIAVLFCKK